MAVSSPRTRNLLVFALEVAVAAALIGWLIRAGALNFSALALIVEKPELLAINLGVFMAGTTLGALRWRALLGLAGVRLPFRRIVGLHLVALFFNVVIPGNVGGDAIKALYVARDTDPAKRISLLLVVFIERLMGLAGLVLVATTGS